MILKEKLPKFRGIGLKTVVYSVLPIYWAMLLVSTFLHWSWSTHRYTKFASPRTKFHFMWNIQRIPLSLLLAPRNVGLCACTLARRFWSLLTLAWRLNPWLPAGRLVACGLRACKLAPLLPELGVIFWVMPCHVNVYRNTRLVWTCPSTVCSCRNCCSVQGPGMSCQPGWWLSTSMART